MTSVAFQKTCMFQTAIADGVVLTPGWILGVLGGSGTVIAFLFHALMASKDRQIEAREQALKQLQEDFDLFVEQVKKDELRRDKEDAHVKALIDEAIRLKNKSEHETRHSKK